MLSKNFDFCLWRVSVVHRGRTWSLPHSVQGCNCSRGGSYFCSKGGWFLWDLCFIARRGSKEGKEWIIGLQEENGQSCMIKAVACSPGPLYSISCCHRVPDQVVKSDCVFFMFWAPNLTPKHLKSTLTLFWKRKMICTLNNSAGGIQNLHVLSLIPKVSG